MKRFGKKGKDDVGPVYYSTLQNGKLLERDKFPSQLD